MPINSFLYPAPSTPTFAYEVANSCRFNDDDSPRLSKTPGDGSRRKFTFSAWIKRGNLTGSNMCIFSPGHKSSSAGNDRLDISFHSTNGLRITQAVGGLHSSLDVRSSQLFRDVSAWYHIVVAIDTEQSTASDRVKMYSNGTQITDFATSTYPSLNADLKANNYSAVAYDFSVGGFTELGFFDGYMAEVVFIDGQQLAADQFGEFDSDSPNIWKPIDVSGLTFGNNGFYLDFENSGSLGADVSGNSNNFTVNNLTSIDQTTDTCTNNFCTLNPLVAATSRTDNQNYSEGNTIIIPNSTDNYGTTFSTIGVQGSGKWYWEAQIVWNGTSNNANFPRTIGFVTEDYAFNYSYLGQDQESWGMMFSDETPDQWFASHPDENNNEGGTMANGDTVNLALDLDNGYFYFGINGTYINSGNPTSGASGTGAVFTLTATDLSKFIIPAVTNATNTTYYKFNFGNPAYSISSGNSDANGLGNFENAVPSGYFSLCSSNLADFG